MVECGETFPSECPWVGTDEWLWRFILATRDANTTPLPKNDKGEEIPHACALDRVKACLAWRRDNGVNTILLEEGTGEEEEEEGGKKKGSSFCRRLSREWPVQVHGEDVRGVPVVVERVACVSPRPLLQRYTMDQVWRYAVLSRERLQWKLHQLWLKKKQQEEEEQEQGQVDVSVVAEGASNDNIEQDNEELKKKETEASSSKKPCRGMSRYVMVESARGIGLRHSHSPLFTLLDRIFMMDERFYPCSLHHAFVVDVPWLFSLFKSLLSPFVSSENLAKIRLYSGSNYLEEMTKFIEAHHIPRELQGSCKSCQEDGCFKPFSEESLLALDKEDHHQEEEEDSNNNNNNNNNTEEGSAK